MKGLIAALLVTAACFVPARTDAATDLTSAPLKGGAGGLICSCTNLTQDTIVVDIFLLFEAGATACNNLTISGNGFVDSCSSATTTVRACRVRRDDGKAASSQHLACSLASLDGAGNITATIPVDKKGQQ